MEVEFLNSSNDIISGELDDILPDQDKVPGEIEPEKIRNDYNAKISEDYDENIEVEN